jgi:hypothetical protein
MTKLGIYAKAHSYKLKALAKKYEMSKPANGEGSETQRGSYHLFHEGIGLGRKLSKNKNSDHICLPILR